jgi:acyl-CoA thioesterase
MSLSAILDVAFTDSAELSVTIPLEWLQGRTAYGGLSAAIALTAAKAAYADLPPLRSAQIAFVGPLSGTVVAQPSLLRRGKNSAFVACDVTSNDGVGLRALFLFMASRTSAIAHIDLSPPDFPLGDDRADLAKMPPGFLANFELSSWQANDGTVRRWVRLRDRKGMDAEVELIVIADALPPAAMTLAKEWGPISTTTWQLNLVTDTPNSCDGWWLLEAKTLYAGNGNSSQTMTIWNSDGAAQATATQSVALFI